MSTEARYSSTFDDPSPAARDGFPGGLIRQFEVDRDVSSWLQKQGHLQEDIAHGKRLDVSADSSVGLVGGHGKGLAGGCFVRLIDERFPDGGVDSVRITLAWWKEVEHQQMNVLVQEFD